MKKWTVLMLCVAVIFSVSCASQSHKVTRTASDEAIDLSGRWNDTDSRLVAEEMIRDVLSRAWIDDFNGANEGKKPVVIVGRIRNKSSEHIATDVFIKDLERELINGGRIKFVASKAERGELRSEKEDQQSNATEDSAKKLASETGADFMLQGTISSVTDAVEGQKVVFYQVDLELVNIESNEKVWIGSKKIKKVVEQAKSKW
ncbi:MAG TPA: penicillin-binding protein activator LpoB [bacterium]|nr:penicillin-binding protein activator LpoB [bacterium]